MKNIWHSYGQYKNYGIIFLVFYLSFLLFTPLGPFNNWISPEEHTGYYSITKIDPGDDAGYYAYLRSTFFDKDVDFFNEKWYWHHDRITDTGYAINHWAIGSAILWLPFFFLGHVIAYIYNIFGYNVTLDGYSFPYHTMTAIGSSVYVFLGLILSYKFLLNFFSKKASIIATLSVFLSTPILFHTFIRQRGAHTGEFFLIVATVYLWYCCRKKHNEILLYVLLGILSGLLFIVRYDRAIFLTIPLLDYLIQGITHLRNNKWKELLLLLRNISLAATTFIIVSLSQFVIWKILFGIPVPGSHLYLFDVTFTNIITKLKGLFFGSDWGVFLQEPIWIVGLAGLFIFSLKQKYLVCLFWLCIVLVIFVDIFIAPSISSYGKRYLLCCNLFITFGVASLLDYIKRKRDFIILVAFSLALIFWQYIELIQFKITLSYSDPNYMANAIKNIPTIFFDRQDFLLRSTSFFHLLFMSDIQLENYLDWFYIILLPLLMMFIAFLLLFFLAKIFYIIKNPTQLNKMVTTALVAILVCFFIAVDVMAFYMNKTKDETEMFTRYKEAALSRIKRGENDAAMEYIINASKYKDDDHDLHYLLGELYLSKGLFEQSYDQLQHAVGIKNNSIDAHFALGKVLYKKGDLTHSEVEFQKVISLSPDHADAIRNIGIIQYDQGRHSKSVINLEKYLTIHPNVDDADKIKDLIKLMTLKK